MDPQVVGVRVALLVVGVGDDYVGRSRRMMRDQPSDGLVEIGVGEAVVAGLFASVPGMPESRYPSMYDVVVADDLGRPVQLLAAHRRQVRLDLGVSIAGLRMSPASPPVQHTSTLRAIGLVLATVGAPLDASSSGWAWTVSRRSGA